jgi:hypothetical protein
VLYEITFGAFYLALDAEDCEEGFVGYLGDFSIAFFFEGGAT